MKSAARKVLKKVPLAFHVARRCQEGYRTHVSMAGQRRETAKNLSIMRSMSGLAVRLKLKKAVFSGKSVDLWLDDGTAFRLCPDEVNPLLTIPLNGGYEPENTAFLMRTIRPGWTVFDIGANFGWYSVHFSKAVGARGAVHAFEPLPGVVARLRENIGLNGLGNVTVCPKALGRESGALDLYTPDDLGSAYSCVYPEGRKTRAEMTTLDEYAGENKIPRVDLIKADIEGGEFDALRGGEKTLKRDRPDLFLEVQECHTENFGYAPRDIFAYLEDLGYAIYRIGRNSGKLEEVKDFKRLDSFNFYCTAKKGRW